MTKYVITKKYKNESYFYKGEGNKENWDMFLHKAKFFYSVKEVSVAFIELCRVEDNNEYKIEEVEKMGYIVVRLTLGRPQYLLADSLNANGFYNDEHLARRFETKEEAEKFIKDFEVFGQHDKYDIRMASYESEPN